MVSKVDPYYATNFPTVGAELDLLYKGTTRYIFDRRPAQVTPSFDPLGLPADPFQCAHVEMHSEELSEGYEVIYPRCLKDANGRNGFLCEEHDRLIDLSVQRRARRVWVDHDQELVDSIIASESKALANTIRDVVQVGAKVRIQFVSATID